MDLDIINPIEYPAWNDLLLHSGDFSFFHTDGWARVLADSYGYKPIYFAHVSADRLSFLMPFMQVESLLTGKRGVSLPFSDACDILADDKKDISAAIQFVIGFGRRSRWKYVEWRSAVDLTEAALPFETYFTHDIGLERTELELSAGLKEGNRRNIRKASKEGVRIKIDQSPESLGDFYHLHSLTRKRHGLPPQPSCFFRNVLNHVLSRNSGIIVSAVFSGVTIASLIFFHFGSKAIYKYGASLTEYQHMRPNNLAMWEAVKWYRNAGFLTMNLGRTESKNVGLLQYKRTWGGDESHLKYFRFDIKDNKFIPSRRKTSRLSERFFARTPTAVLRLLGNLLYRHMG